MKAKNSLAALIVALASSSAFAQDALHNTVLSVEGVAAVEQKKLTGVSQEVETAERTNKYREAEAFIDPIESASRVRELSQQEHALALAKLKMEEANIREQLSELESRANQRTVEALFQEKKLEWEAESAGIIRDYTVRIAELESKVSELKENLERKDQVDEVLKSKIFVTKVFGIGQNLKARIYFDNNIVTKRVGEEIIPGAIVDKIDSNGVLVSFNGENQYIAITTTDHAHHKTFEASKDSPFGDEPPPINGFPANLRR